MTSSALYQAPFAEGGTSPLDAVLAERLLGVALSKGGDYADLFFEYRAAGGLVFDDGILKSASRGVSMGLGVRVQKGDATGYAYVEQFDWEAMKRAAETAAQIADGKGGTVAVSPVVQSLPHRYDLVRVTLDEPGTTKRALLERAAAAAHAFDPRIIKVEASLAEEIREILVVTSDGKWARDTQPLVRFGVRAMELLHEGKSGRMVALQADHIVDLPLSEATRQRKVVDAEWLALADIFCEGPALSKR
jgi:TldD protein